ncbi:MAG: prepilin-type N-terminal cleavage/methylation domain-containing protein [Schlesneria sp.]
MSNRRAFTLVELLVVLAIVLILAAVTISSVNFSYNADRMRAGGRQLQSFLMGARDKAIYANEVRGVRLLIDPNDNHAVSAVQYIGAPQRETGMLTFNPISTPANSIATNDPTGRTVAFISGTRWSSLSRRGLLRVGNRIQIPQDTGAWFTISALNAGSGLILLNRPNPDLAGTVNPISFALELASTPLGDAQPVQLPRGTVIDLDGSQVPTAWRPFSLAASYSPQMDILFTPRGTVIGDTTTLGIVHLLVSDASDVLKWKSTASLSGSINNVQYGRNTPYVPSSLPLVPAENTSVAPPIVPKDRIIVTISTRTGHVAVYPINPVPQSSSGNPSLAVDPFLFAESGRVANK